MVLEKDEYRIEGEGIWISKKALEKCRDHYCKIADRFKPKLKKPYSGFRCPFYIGKADVCIDLLKIIFNNSVRV